MKKVIGGKVFNTETAELVGYGNNGLPTSDFGFVRETLYRSQKVIYFLAGKEVPRVNTRTVNRADSSAELT